MTVAMRVDGVDISRHQRHVRIDWTKLKRAGCDWMYHKSSEGGSFKDEAYGTRRKQAADNGMPFGPYHFARPSGGDARAEARFFIDVANFKRGDLRPCLDLETTEIIRGKALLEWADNFCDEVKDLTGAVPLVYTPYMLSKELEDKALFWVPRYNNDNRRPVRDWDIWQFSNGVLGVPNQVAGIGHVDLNYSSKVGVNALRFPSKVSVPKSRGRRIEEAIDLLVKAEKGAAEGTRRDDILDKAIAELMAIKPL